MDLKHLKTIFIFVLLALNIIFCAIIYNAKNYEKAEMETLTKSITSLLAEDMIFLPPQISLPQSPDISNYYLEKMFGDNDELITKFLGENKTQVSETDYSSDKGLFHLSGDEFKFTNKSPSASITDFSEGHIEKLCRQEMKRLGILSDLYVFSGINFVDDAIRAIFTAQQGDFAFFDAYISFDISPQGISSISGRNMVSNLEAIESGDAFFNITSILPGLSENPLLEKNVAYTIVSIIPGYYIGKTAESYHNILAIPVWQIATDSGAILYYDARNGEYILE